MLKTQGSDNLAKYIGTVTKSWKDIENNLEKFREKIAADFFCAHPDREQLFKSMEEKQREDKQEGEKQGEGKEDEERKNREKKLYKHSVAVLNWMEVIVDFINGNEETKPVLFLLGKHHKQQMVIPKMFLEMKDSICRVVEKELGGKVSYAWKIIVEYIYITYVFPGMDLIDVTI